MHEGGRGRRGNGHSVVCACHFVIASQDFRVVSSVAETLPFPTLSETLDATGFYRGNGFTYGSVLRVMGSRAF